MHFLQIISHYVPAYHFGGALHVVHALSRTFLAQGHEVRVCTTNLKDPTCNLDVKPGTPLPVDGVMAYYEPVQISRAWGLSFPLMWRIWQQATWADVVFIHFHYQFASVIGGWICRLLRKPYIVFTHGSLNRYGVSLRSRSRKLLYLNLLERGNFRNALFVAYHSQEEMGNSFQFGHCRVSPNGIDPQAFQNLPPHGYFRDQYPELKERLVYLYLGRLDAGKGLDLLLPAFRHLASKRPEVHLVLAGGNERGYETVVRQMITDLNLADRVTLTGLISGPEKLGALQDADVYVLPSRSEGLSMAMLEAMYMGLPVIVSDRVGLWRTIEAGHCGLVVPLDIERLADALAAMTSKTKRIEMGAQAAALVREHYIWPVIAQNLVAQLESSLSI